MHRSLPTARALALVAALLVPAVGACDSSSGSSSVAIDCAGFCGHQAAVVAELGCTDARTESDCLSQCENTVSNLSACRSEFAADIACESQAPTSEYSCSTTAGEAPVLDVSNGSSCTEEVGALLQCATGQ